MKNSEHVPKLKVPHDSTRRTTRTMASTDSPSPAWRSRPQPPGWTPIKSQENCAHSPAQATPTPAIGGGSDKRGRSPGQALSERSPNGGNAPELAPGLWRAALRPTGLLVQTPGGTLQTPGGGRNPNRRRLRSPGMMSSPFKSSRTFGGTPLKASNASARKSSARKPRASGTPSKSPMPGSSPLQSPSTITYGITNLFVSPGGSSAHGSPHVPPPPPPGPPPGLDTPNPHTMAEANPAAEASPFRFYDPDAPTALKWNDVRRASQDMTLRKSPSFSSPICKIEEDEPLLEPPVAQPLVEGTPEKDTANQSEDLDSSLLRAMSAAEDDDDEEGPEEPEEAVPFVGPRISEQMAEARASAPREDDSDLDDSMASSMLEQSLMMDSSGLDLVDLKDADESETDMSVSSLPRQSIELASPAVPGRKPKPAERPGWEVAWSNSQQDWYWWNPETRESTWTDPAKYELVPRKVVLRKTETDKKMVVTELKILSEDGGYSDVKLVKGADETKYALKAMQRSDVHWDNVTNEKEVMVELDMCSHPFLVGLIATGKDKDTLYMLLELCPGGDLFSRLDEERHFDDTVSRFYISQCVLGLEALHRGSVRGPTSGRDMYLHRDIKPENVLMGGDGYIMMADFGFTLRMLHNERTYSQVGTTEYMAPELINNSGYNQCADYWSIGILIYELLVGSTPFAGDNDSKKEQHARILAYANGAEMEWPGAIHVSAAAKSIVESLLARDPMERLGMGAETAAGGCAEILAHKWFDEIDLDQLKRKVIEPPWVPKGGAWPAEVPVPEPESTFGRTGSKTKVKCGSVTADGGAGYRGFRGGESSGSESDDEDGGEDYPEDEVEYCPEPDDDFADF